MAAAKKSNKRKGSGRSTSGRKNTRKKQAQKQGVTTGFQTEIILLSVLAASIILIISNLGMGGVVGAAISKASFGIMGLVAYIFPIVIFGGAAFLVSNRGNMLAYKKALAALVFLVFLCGLAQLLTEGYMSSTTMAEYYAESSTYHTGGGVIGGAICISTTSAFGTAGGYVIVVLVLLITLILITQKSFFGFVFRIWDAICALAKDGRDMYMEGQPERDLKKEIREQERRQKREERHAQKMRELEAALAEDKTKDGVNEEEQDLHTGFLDGTLLSPPIDKKKKKRRIQRTPENPVQEKTEITEQAVVESEGQDAGWNLAEQAAPQESMQTELPALEKEPITELVPQADEFEIHRAEPQEAYVEAEESEESAVPEQDIYQEAIVEPEMQEDYPELSAQEMQETYTDPVSETVPEEVPQPESKASSQPVRNPKSSQKEIESGIQNIQKEITQQNEVIKKEYHYPPLKLLKRGDGKSQGDSDEHLRKTAKKLQDTLHNFGVNVTVTNVSCGPTVTRYELQPEMGVKVSKIVNLADDIKLNLATPDIRIEAPIPGKAAVGIEVPNKENHAVMLREILQSQEFQTAKSKLSFAVGKDIAGKPVVTDIAKMPHLLIAGATGSGKSVCINTLIISILYKASPEDVKLIMIDPKVVELSVYNGIPHLFIPVVTDPKKAAGALNWAVTEMMSRYNTFAEYSVRNLQEYNRKVEGMRIPEGEERPEKMPQIIIIVDELADLMMVAPGEVEDAICRLAQLARAAGIHLIIATQRPSVNVITGLIKANMPSRIAFSVSSGVDSRTILDMNGAEKLLGKGDMLFYPQGYQKPARLQGAFVSDEEVSSIVDFLAEKNPGTQYNSQIEQQVNTASAAGGGASSGDDRDVYFVDAGKFIIEKEKASIGMLQRMFKIGFNRAARIMDQLCDAGVVGPEEGTKPRKVLMSAEEFENYIEEYL
ncbi:DNA translocase FtsK [Blautia sp. MSJ-19]|uniref:DNA translocase FtsK n=1 Tax=Blautia sp. MSJ-19 TaxID=2841517 RepID=UPI001C0F24E3|nr:DNA translocase FtsK [Blautia sp. MSJ-19]MBU5481530.1 DNA translocase FtsK [Blautia sp. MSJ-19]